MKPRMRRLKLDAEAEDDSFPVMVPRNDKVVVPTSNERVRRLRKHLVMALRALRTMKNPKHSVSPLRPEPEGFAGRVARAACSLYEGSCIFHGKQGCTLDRSLRSDICNSYFCDGLQNYMTGGDAMTPTMIIAGVGDNTRTSPILVP